LKRKLSFLVSKRIDSGELIVIGEKTVPETAEGLGGEFTSALGVTPSTWTAV
jgi:hypothetical protein